MKTKRSGLTVIEILVVVGIIALLVGMLLPAVHTVQKMARETKQKAQFTSIELGLAAFKNDYGDYPPSDWQGPVVGGVGDYCGAQKLAEALVGWDLLGFHPSSAWRSDGLDNGGGGTVYTASDTLEKRNGRYVDLDTANAFLLGGGPDALFPDTSGSWGGALAPRTYVLCDVFPVNERKVILGNEKTVSPGTPILYYRANPASKVLFPLPGDLDVLTEARIYNARDNAALIGLGRLADAAKPAGMRRLHKLDGSCLLEPEEVRRLLNPGDVFLYFYQLYIRDPRVQQRPWPYRPDSYLLISAGADGLYGTDDDICNFGK